MASSLPVLIPECLEEIILYVPLRQRLTLRKVCKQWRDVVDNHWRKIQKLQIYYLKELSSDIGPKRLEQTLIYDYRSKICLWTREAVFVDKLIGLCSRYLTTFIEIRHKCDLSISKSLRSCQNLQELTITITSSADDEIVCDVFRVNKKIKQLCIEFQTKTAFECLKFFQSNALEELRILKRYGEHSSYNVIPFRVDIIRNASSLKKYSSNEVSIPEFDIIGEKVNLETLILSEHCYPNPRRAQKLRGILNLKNLKVLHFSTQGISLPDDIVIAVTKNCQQLVEVSIVGSRDVTNNSILALAKLPHLKVLEVLAVSHITDEFLWQFSQVEKLSLRACNNVGDPGIIKLLQCSQIIQCLKLQQTKVTTQIINVANEEVKKRIAKISLTLILNYDVIAANDLHNMSSLLYVTHI